MWLFLVYCRLFTASRSVGSYANFNFVSFVPPSGEGRGGSPARYSILHTSLKAAEKADEISSSRLVVFLVRMYGNFRYVTCLYV
ncbi:hypothetical protein GGR50DRAFT_648948, partial [Xylaria sp. CBS 124048]